MSIGKVAAGCAGFLLLLPGLCFVIVGGSTFADKKVNAMMIEFIVVGLAILVAGGALIRIAFRPSENQITHPTEQEPPKTE